MGKLEQHKGSNKCRGIIVGLDNPQNGMGYSEGVNKDGRKNRKIKFGVKTSKDNIIYYELFGSEQDWAYISKKNQDGKFDTIKIPFAERNNNHGDYRLVGRHIKKDDFEGFFVDYDAPKVIAEHFHDGDVVTVIGENVFTEYNDKPIVNYKINNIYKSDKELNFDAPDFEELNDFIQEIVFVSSSFDNKENKVYITAYIIGYKDKFNTAIFVVDNQKYPALANTFRTKFKFGDQLKVAGKIHNRVETIEVEVEVNEEYGEIPGGYKQAVTNRRREMEITGIFPDSIYKGIYTEADFVKPVEEEMPSLEELQEDGLPF